MAASTRTVYPPERRSRKALLSLTEDVWSMLDDCAKAMGMSRSAFLQVFFDSYAEKVIDFVEGWLTGIKYYTDKVAANKRLPEAKRAAKTMGLTVSERPKP